MNPEVRDPPAIRIRTQSYSHEVGSLALYIIQSRENSFCKFPQAF